MSLFSGANVCACAYIGIATCNWLTSWDLPWIRPILPPSAIINCLYLFI